MNLKRVEEYFLSLQVKVNNTFNKREIKFENLPVLIGMACLFWLFSLTQYSISIDDEYAIFRRDNSVWLGQGRWGIYLLTEFVLPQAVVPFLPNLILCITLSTSYLILLYAHGMRLSKMLIAAFPIFMGFPTWYFLSEFYANTLAVSIGLVLSSTALFLFSDSIKEIINNKRQNESRKKVSRLTLLLSLSIKFF